MSHIFGASSISKLSEALGYIANLWVNVVRLITKQWWILRGTQGGGAPLLEKSCFVWEVQHPKRFGIDLNFQSLCSHDSYEIK